MAMKFIDKGNFWSKIYYCEVRFRYVSLVLLGRDGKERDVQKAISMCKETCNEYFKDGPADATLANLYYEGKDVECNHDLAYKYAKMARGWINGAHYLKF
ncbi:MAG: hypothetical protein SOZ48_06925 [Eubacterium sp.]|nr:hypothetical protein [Eubacterium sp.]